MWVPPAASDGAPFRRETGIEAPFALYLGRLDEVKGVRALVDAHGRSRAAGRHGLDLVLAGGGPLEPPEHPWLHVLGRVDERLKHASLSAASVVCVPSPFESLSFLQLEAWSYAKPTLVNAHSPVLLGQSRRSGGGMWYRDADEYGACLARLSRGTGLAQLLGLQGRRFVEREHSENVVAERRRDAIAEVAASA